MDLILKFKFICRKGCFLLLCNWLFLLNVGSEGFFCIYIGKRFCVDRYFNRLRFGEIISVFKKEKKYSV